MPIGAALVAAAGIGGIASISGARSQASAARAAANAQAAAADQATQFQRDAANYAINQGRPVAQQQAYLNGLRLAGLGVPTDQINSYLRDSYGASLQNLPNGNTSTSPNAAFWNATLSPNVINGSASNAPQLPANYDFAKAYRNTPGYQAGLDAQQKALERRAAAGGDFFSGGFAQQFARNASDYEDRNYQQYWNNLGNAFTPNSTSAQGDANQVAINFGNNAASNAIGAGNARATAYQNIGNAKAAGAYGVANSINGAIGAWGGYQGWW